MSVPTDTQLNELARRLSRALSGRGWRLATAESCTGGWIAKTLTDLAGSSDWFERGYVVYSNAAKVADLGVPADVIEARGAVSREVAEAAAAGCRVRAQVDCALAVTGIAGPSGGTATKPVGLVWFAWAVGDAVSSLECQFDGGRDAVRQQAVAMALSGLLERLEAERGA